MENNLYFSQILIFLLKRISAKNQFCQIFPKKQKIESQKRDFPQQNKFFKKVFDDKLKNNVQCLFRAGF